jgi:hypothetical protein
LARDSGTVWAGSTRGPLGGETAGCGERPLPGRWGQASRLSPPPGGVPHDRAGLAPRLGTPPLARPRAERETPPDGEFGWGGTSVKA